MTFCRAGSRWQMDHLCPRCPRYDKSRAGLSEILREVGRDWKTGVEVGVALAGFQRSGVAI